MRELEKLSLNWDLTSAERHPTFSVSKLKIAISASVRAISDTTHGQRYRACNLNSVL